MVDTFDALVHDRVYRPAKSEEEALTILREGAGTHFDPRLLAHFFRRLPEIRKIIAEHPDTSRESPPEVDESSAGPVWPSFQLPSDWTTPSAGQPH
jgi:HD-GYP domain-containing protein (c-di-GMP phosphodiesterase class II)